MSDIEIPLSTPPGLFRRLARDPAALIAGGFLGLVILAAVFAPWLAPYDPYETVLRDMLHPPEAAHWFGTDAQGRDILSRMLYGARLTLLMGIGSVVVGATVGSALGLVSAFYPLADRIIGRIVDMLLSFPSILLGLALAAVLGTGALPVMLALAVATIPEVARIARGSALGVMRMDYVMAGRAVGLSDGTLIWRYVARNGLPPVFVFVTLRFGQIVLLGAGLSFLGLGARPPTAELGMMAAQGRDFLFFAPHVATLPSLAIFAIVLAFNMLGDAVRDALDPRLQ